VQPDNTKVPRGCGRQEKVGKGGEKANSGGGIKKLTRVERWLVEVAAGDKRDEVQRSDGPWKITSEQSNAWEVASETAHSVE